MPTFVTRRAALGIVAAAALASLTACASDIRPLEDPSVVDPMRPYKGELKFNSYKSTGTYRPASSTKKAENPPMPTPPVNMKSKTTSGMYAAIGYWVASLNYLTVTGDDTPLKAVDMDVIYVRKMEAYVELYKKNEGWMYGTETPLVAELTEETPQKVDDEQYRWKGIVHSHKDAVLHYVPEDRDIRLGEPSGGSSNDEVTFVLKYRNDAWMVTVETKSSSTATPDSSGGSNSGLNV
ncbi:3-isopropylmalate dehydrogenase [Rothia sp. HMSC068E02]|jgi:hypothetical protein|uniref:DUF6318 family protein n=1 Tax=Rothia sp. HMSC068E02 TaxID=1739423 RepID=UPI0008A1501E|nr:DUF6318 family protein [Rothia sp. HMSC068E02]OFQ75202.1 3-isopropylmalate dehydrogenase [Rothia sp. HMSC068E02]